jgi:hypothetical protein
MPHQPSEPQDREPLREGDWRLHPLAQEARKPSVPDDSIVGLARRAFAQGDHVFQCSLQVAAQEAVVAAMVGTRVVKTSGDPNEVLNAICSEGWDLVNGSFVFEPEGERSRDRFLASGQQVAVQGQTVGYYLFRRRSQVNS